MADIGIVGAAPGTLITERPLEEVEQRLSVAVAENDRRASVASTRGARRPSVFEQTLSKIDPEKLDFRRRSTLVTPRDLEIVRQARQIHGEAFAAGGETRYYEPIDSYESKHRWDPTAEWTEKEERQIVRKLDLRICSWVCLMFFALQLDRGNIAQALTDTFLSECRDRQRWAPNLADLVIADLGLNTNQYNYGQTVFYISFLCAELPS